MPTETAVGPPAWVLASASPRRVALLRKVGLEFIQRPADIDESVLPDEAPERLVVRLARQKAQAVWRPGTKTLGADTVVALGSEILGKPDGPEQARRMLLRLSDRTHRVLTGVAVYDGDACVTLCEVTSVRFRKLSESEIDRYVATGEPLDKAGSYGIQGRAGRFVESVNGSFDNVVGLPVRAVLRMLG